MGLLLSEIVLAYRMASLNKFNDIDSSIVYEVNKTVFCFYKTYFKPKTHKTITSN